MGVPNEKLVDVPVQQAGNIIMNIHLGMVVLEQQVDYDALPLTALFSHQRKLDYLPCAAMEGTFTFVMRSIPRSSPWTQLHLLRHHLDP